MLATDGREVFEELAEGRAFLEVVQKGLNWDRVPVKTTAPLRISSFRSMRFFGRTMVHSSRGEGPLAISILSLRSIVRNRSRSGPNLALPTACARRPWLGRIANDRALPYHRVMTFREIEREALGLAPADRARLAEIMLQSLGQVLKQLNRGGARAATVDPDRATLEARVEAVFSQAFSGQAEVWTDEHWDRLLREELPDLERTELDLLALPAAHRA